METKILEDIGLTPGEIKVYIALLESGPSTAGNILKKANIQNSVFHFNINRLIEKGLVSYKKINKFRVYKAAEPDKFLDYLKDKESKIKKFLPQLKERQAKTKQEKEVELFEGVKGITTLFNILVEDSKKGDEFLFFAPDLPKIEEIQKFYEMYDIKRHSRGLLVKGIAPKKLKPLFKKRRYTKMKYTDMPLPANTSICNKMAIMSWDEKPFGILISSRNIIQRQKDFFNALWKKI